LIQHPILEVPISKLISIFPFRTVAWFAPSVIARVLRSLVQRRGPKTLTMYVPSDGVIYTDKVYQVCTQAIEKSNSRVNIINAFDAEMEEDQHRTNEEDEAKPQCESEIWKSVLILVPLRLGVDSINSIYYKSLLTCLRMPQSLGIIGGKPKQSFYFVGCQDDYLIYLDPHIVHESVRVEQPFSDETYHCSIPQKMHIADVDPSLAVGFYCHTKNDFLDLCSQITKMASISDSVLGLQEKQPVYGSDDEEEDFAELE